MEKFTQVVMCIMVTSIAMGVLVGMFASALNSEVLAYVFMALMSIGLIGMLYLVYTMIFDVY